MARYKKQYKDQVKEYCKGLIANLKDAITFTTVNKGMAKTAAQKKAYDNLIAASKECQNAYNTCDENCVCKDKESNVEIACVRNAYMKLNTAQADYRNAMLCINQ